MTLIFELDLDIVKVHPYTEIWVHRSNGSAVRVLTDGQTDRQTDGTDSITSTADTGGKNMGSVS